MKDAEDEAFDDLAKRQGDWGSGFQAKRQMAADKLQEPVAWRRPDKHKTAPMYEYEDGITSFRYDPSGEPLYAYPPQRPWVGLTDEEIKEIIGTWGDTPIKGYTRKLFDQIETKLKEKNT